MDKHGLAAIIAIYDETLSGLRALRNGTTDPVKRARIEATIAEEQSARNVYHTKLALADEYMASLANLPFKTREEIESELRGVGPRTAAEDMPEPGMQSGGPYRSYY
jgi:hypothetical protein